MGVTVRWVLGREHLALNLLTGQGALDRQIEFAITSELPEPFEWLSGGELLLTTGLRLPEDRAARQDYLDGLHRCGISALAFGIGLTHPRVPDDLVDHARRLGLPLLEVPRPTPFAAVVRAVMDRLAELQYDAVLRASRAQPRMTRAAIAGGPRAIVRELAAATRASAVLLDRCGRIVEAHPNLDAAGEAELHKLIAGSAGRATSSASETAGGRWVTVQRIEVGRHPRGHLAVVGSEPLGSVEQILLGHANSLLALDFEKPARLRVAQTRLNGHAFALALAQDGDLSAVHAQLADAAGADGTVRALTVLCRNSTVSELVEAVETGMTESGRPLFLLVATGEVTVLLRGADDTAFAARLVAGVPANLRRSLRIGLGGTAPPDQVAATAEQSRIAAHAADVGGAPREFGATTGTTLLTLEDTRRVLLTLGDATIAPLAEYDRGHGTDLVVSLRAYLEANGSWEIAAAALGVHRHTLRSRIRRAEALTGCDLGVARVRAELLLALLARGS